MGEVMGEKERYRKLEDVECAGFVVAGWGYGHFDFGQ
jgi:hypothetical protein